jgi:hypothetical protein
MAIVFHSEVDKYNLLKNTEKNVFHVFATKKGSDGKTLNFVLETASLSEDVALANVSVYARLGKETICLFRKGNTLFRVENDGKKILY